MKNSRAATLSSARILVSGFLHGSALAHTSFSPRSESLDASVFPIWPLEMWVISFASQIRRGWAPTKWMSPVSSHSSLQDSCFPQDVKEKLNLCFFLFCSQLARGRQRHIFSTRVFRRYESLGSCFHARPTFAVQLEKLCTSNAAVLIS